MKYSFLFLGAFLALLSGCSSTGTKNDSRVGAVTTTVDREQAELREDELTNTLTAELEGWDERISELKSRALTTRNRDRFKLLSGNINDLEEQMSDARESFIDLRTAQTDGSRNSAKDEINANLQEMRKIYNNLPAE